ncbi:hypothetical protein QE152_g23433 [Popillia japonica]|uniref:Uncharacterized protein n=1 Tax=Popillia japonica TaxID=7064 RepID=A0AAW1KFC7_POPJA
MTKKSTNSPRGRCKQFSCQGKYDGSRSCTEPKGKRSHVIAVSIYGKLNNLQIKDGLRCREPKGKRSHVIAVSIYGKLNNLQIKDALKKHIFQIVCSRHIRNLLQEKLERGCKLMAAVCGDDGLNPLTADHSTSFISFPTHTFHIGGGSVNGSTSGGGYGRVIEEYVAVLNGSTSGGGYGRVIEEYVAVQCLGLRLRSLPAALYPVMYGQHTLH